MARWKHGSGCTAGACSSWQFPNCSDMPGVRNGLSRTTCWNRRREPRTGLFTMTTEASNCSFRFVWRLMFGCLGYLLNVAIHAIFADHFGDDYRRPDTAAAQFQYAGVHLPAGLQTGNRSSFRRSINREGWTCIFTRSRRKA